MILLAAASTSALAQPGTLGFLVVFGMAVILYFVFRSMSRHLRKVNEAARQDQIAATTGIGAKSEDGPVSSPSRNGQSGL